MGKFRISLVTFILYMIAWAGLYYGGGYIGYLIKGKPRATEYEKEEWSRIRHELDLLTYTDMLNDYYDAKQRGELEDFHKDEEEINWDVFLSNDKAAQDKVMAKARAKHSEKMKKVQKYCNEGRGGYGILKTDYIVPYETWIGDPMSYRINCMSFRDKVLYGWGLHKYFRK